ncbi:hypothetical protein U1Q18_032750 [Sarracenia purpurea var. burkii]
MAFVGVCARENLFFPFGSDFTVSVSSSIFSLCLNGSRNCSFEFVLVFFFLLAGYCYAYVMFFRDAGKIPGLVVQLPKWKIGVKCVKKEIVCSWIAYGQLLLLETLLNG